MLASCQDGPEGSHEDKSPRTSFNGLVGSSPSHTNTNGPVERSRPAIQYHQQIKSTACSFPAYGFPIIFTSRHTSTPIRGVYRDSIQTTLPIQSGRRPSPIPIPRLLPSLLQVLTHPLFQEKALPPKDSGRVVHMKVIAPPPYESVHPIQYIPFRLTVAPASRESPDFITKAMFGLA